MSAGISQLVTPPATEPVTLNEAKEHLRIEHDVDDAFISTLITVAREYVEKIAWRGFIDQTWELTLREFPIFDYITLPKGPVRSVTSVQYLDPSGVLQTLATSVYEVDTKSKFGRVILKEGQSWPGYLRRWNSVTVQYVVGYTNLPKGIVHAIKLLIAQMYEHRTPEVTGTIVAAVRMSFDALLAPYRAQRF
jgi:uncharacterized phiE125 gp8 family phage protein